MKPSPFRQKERGGQPRALAPVPSLFIDTHAPPSRAVPKMAQKRCCRVEVFGEPEESYCTRESLMVGLGLCFKNLEVNASPVVAPKLPFVIFWSTSGLFIFSTTTTSNIAS